MLASLKDLEGASDSHSEIQAARSCAIHDVAPRKQGKARDRRILKPPHGNDTHHSWSPFINQPQSCVPSNYRAGWEIDPFVCSGRKRNQKLLSTNGMSHTSLKYSHPSSVQDSLNRATEITVVLCLIMFLLFWESLDGSLFHSEEKPTSLL